MVSTTAIPRIGFRPPIGYSLDVEVFTSDVWRERVPAEHFKVPTRLEFHQLILVTQGRFKHTVDFQLQSANSGSLLTMRPGQVQRFESNKSWEGYVVIFRPESFQEVDRISGEEIAFAVDDLPVHLSLEPASFNATRETLVQMQMDASLGGSPQLIRALARSQLQAFLFRLMLASETHSTILSTDSSLSRHFKKFRYAIEKRFSQWHQISLYANALGVSEKTLNRATQQIAGLAAKAYLSKRIALEAKRMLAYTDWPIARVAEHLGFDETTNFIKFFRREAEDAPSQFRKHHRT